MMDEQKQTHVVEWTPNKAFRKEDEARLWFHDSLHNNPPITPMGASLYHWPRGTKVAADWISFPYSAGFDFVLYDGRIYPGVIPITDPEEIKAKEPVFGGKLKNALDNWPKFYADGVKEWTNMLSYLRGINKRTLPLDRLLIVLQDTVKISKRSWELHFIYMYPSIFAYMTFEAICHEYDINERDMRIFLQGFETKMFELDRAMWRLADLAREMKLVEIFDRADNLAEADNKEKATKIKEMLNESDLGKVWLDQFDHLLEQFGRRSTASVFDPYYETWNEDPYPVISTIKTYIQKGGFDFEEHTKKIIEERDKFIAETIERIPEHDRDRFKGALLHAQYSYPFNEDHNYYVEQWTYAELRYSILECGYRLKKFGLLKEQEDVFFLTITELENVLADIILSEKIGILDHREITKMIEDRKATFNELKEVKAPPFIGTIPEGRVDDPVFIKIWGMTDEVIRGNAAAKEKIAGRFEGFPGAPGVVEGVARVIFGYEGFQEVQPDEVLVAPFTTPAWTPLFSKIRGVVTDSGGMLAHAAICAREYNIPAVVGTITRGSRVTEFVKTGQRIRIDGTNGVVEVIEE